MTVRTPFDRPGRGDIFSSALSANTHREGTEHPPTHVELEHFGRTGQLPDRYLKGNDGTGRAQPYFGPGTRPIWEDLPEEFKNAILPPTTTDAESMGLRPYPTQRDMSIADGTHINDAVKQILQARNRKQNNVSGVSNRSLHGGPGQDPNEGRLY